MNGSIRTISKFFRFCKSGRKCAFWPLIVIFVSNCLLVGVLRSRLTTPVGTTLKSVANGNRSNSKRPMVLSLKYWEQTTNGMKNLFDLQCWASSVHIKEVVEPTVCSTSDDGNGILRFDTENRAPFRDYFDIDYWNKLNSKHGYSVLVSFQNFLESASREMVFVQLKYKEKSSSCKTLEELKEYSWFSFLKGNGFNISTECISVYLSIESNHFWQRIFGPGSSMGSKTIMFEEWRGISISRVFRLQLKNSQCKGLYERSLPKKSGFFIDNINTFPSFSFLLSNKVLTLLDKFVLKYLFGKKFVAVMLRAEKMNSSIFTANPGNNFCMTNILSDYKKHVEILQNAEQNQNVASLFFSDFGRHGSSSWVRRKDWRESAENFSRYLEQAIRPLYKQEELDTMLENVTGSSDTVLLSLLQSGIAAKAEAIVLVGGGSFQQYIWTKYSQSHRHNELYLLRNWQCVQLNL